MNLADYEHMLAGLDADIAGDALPTLGKTVQPLKGVRRGINTAIKLVAFQAGATSATGQIDLWPEPTPLPDGMPPVQAFDADCCPWPCAAG